MLAREARDTVAAHARRLLTDGLVVGTAGNLSARTGEWLAVTPSAVDYARIGPAGICLVDGAGRLVDGRGTPTTELPLHRAAYAATGAAAVVHTHSPYATALSAVVEELPAIHYLIVDLGGPVPVAPYATPGSEELGARVGAALEGRTAVLLRNHGALTVGPTLARAYRRSVLLEWLAATYHRARQVGEPAVLGEQELERVGRLLRDYLDAAD